MASTANTIVSPQIAAESRADRIVVGAIVPFIFCSIFVLARFLARAVILQSWGLDDWFVLLSWVLALGVTVLNLLFTLYGAGRHVAVTTLSGLYITLKLAFASRLLYQIVLCTTKIGICLFNIRIFRDRFSRNCMYGIMASISAYTIAFTFSIIFQCTPVSGAWDITLDPPAVCPSTTPSIVASAVCNVIFDVVLIVFALWRIIPLKMEKTQKRSLLFVISLSFLVVVAAITRVIRVVLLSHSTDYSWDSWDITTWSSVEICTGLFCASAPATKPILRKLLPGLMGSTLDDTTSNTKGYYQKKSRNDTFHGTWTQSKHMGQSIELQSGEGLELGDKSNTVNKFWIGDDESPEKESDSESTKAVLSEQRGSDINKRSKAIMKTVSINVSTERDAGGDSDGPTDSRSAKRFEHV